MFLPTERYKPITTILAVLAILPSPFLFQRSEGLGLFFWFAGTSALCALFCKPGLKWLAVFSGLSIAGAMSLQFSGGILLCIHTFLVLLVISATLRRFLKLKTRDAEKLDSHVVNISLVMGAILICLGLLEMCLTVLNRVLPVPDKPSIASLWRPIPDEWALRTISIPGAEMAYSWHGIVHCHDVAGMRRTSPILPKEGGVFRILVVGDSFTFGEGVELARTFPAILQQELSATHRCEVLNLGIRGLDISGIRKTFLNSMYLMEPDLVVYGVCLNDYIIKPFHEDEFNFNGQKGTLSTFLREKTFTAPFLQALLSQALMACNLKKDFYEEIATDFDQRQKLFVIEAHSMNAAVRAVGCPPVVAMVLEQSPRTEGLPHDLVMTAEENLKAAGLTVISADGYLHEHAGKSLVVSPWEKHPNEEAHRIFAEQFLKHLRERKDLAAFRRTIP